LQEWRCHRSEEVTKVRLGEELIWRREESVMRRLDDETLADERPFGTKKIAFDVS